MWVPGAPQEYTSYETITNEELRPVYAQNLKEDAQPVNLHSRNHLWELAEHERKYDDHSDNWVSIFPSGQENIELPINLLHTGYDTTSVVRDDGYTRPTPPPQKSIQDLAAERAASGEGLEIPYTLGYAGPSAVSHGHGDVGYEAVRAGWNLHRNRLWEQAEHERKYDDHSDNWVSIFPSGQSEIRIPINLHRRNPLWEKAEHESDRTRRSNWENGRGRRVEQVWTQGAPQEYTHYETYDTQELRPVYNLKEDVTPVNLHRRNPLWEKAEHESDRTRRSNWENGRGRRVEQVWTQGEP